MPHFRPSGNFHLRPRKQRGAVLMIMLVIMVMGAATYLVSSLSTTALNNARQEKTAAALAQAKEALIGDAVSQSLVTSAGYLRLPDLGFIGAALTEGSTSAPPNFAGNNKDFSVIGKVPWKTLGIPPLRDGQGECLWYVVSGRFKNYPQTDSLNWDTLGQIDIIDGNGSVIASNIAALLVSPGQPIDGQNRTLSDPIYTQCGGNYVAKNYLDSYNSSDALSGEVNYFTGSTNNRVALNANNKRFVMANIDHYNDRFLFVTVDDIFRQIIRRIDFSTKISELLDDGDFIDHLKNVAIAGAKGTNNVDCDKTSNSDNKKFCNNWKEMILLTALTTPSPITINGVATTSCNRVLIFGGQKTAAQIRLTAADKADPANYLEAPNLTAFTTLPPPASNFSGASTFSTNSPSADLLRCL